MTTFPGAGFFFSDAERRHAGRDMKMNKRLLYNAKNVRKNRVKRTLSKTGLLHDRVAGWRLHNSIEATEDLLQSDLAVAILVVVLVGKLRVLGTGGGPDHLAEEDKLFLGQVPLWFSLRHQLSFVAGLEDQCQVAPAVPLCTKLDQAAEEVAELRPVDFLVTVDVDSTEEVLALLLTAHGGHIPKEFLLAELAAFVAVSLVELSQHLTAELLGDHWSRNFDPVVGHQQSDVNRLVIALTKSKNGSEKTADTFQN